MTAFRPQVIVRLKGGLGNQMFEYAAARALALRNDAELKLDAVSGFAFDRQYQRRFRLGRFAVEAPLASRFESYSDLTGRGRRVLAKLVAQVTRGGCGGYFCEPLQGGADILRTLKVEGKLYLDGLWQDESYFSDHAEQTRRDFSFAGTPPADRGQLEDLILGVEAVGVHVRRLFIPAGGTKPAPIPDENPMPCLTRRPFYQAAIDRLSSERPTAHYFVFSDWPSWARETLRFPGKVTFVECGQGENGDTDDLRLLSLCRHHIISASTFGWWGAWLNPASERSVYAPKDGWMSPGTPSKRWALL